MSSEIRDAVAKVPAPPVLEPPPPPPVPWWPVVLTALLAVVPAAILAALYWHALETNAELLRELADARTSAAVAAAQSELSAKAGAVDAVAAAAPAATVLPVGPAAVEYVPYGQAALANERLERLRDLSAELQAQGFRGRIVVESFIGDFCLTGNAAEGFTVADAGLLSQECDLVGNPFEDSLSTAQRQSVDFANFVATLRQRTGGAIVVETPSASRRNPVEYPEQGEDSTAGEWNAVAQQNNRVEFRLVPGG
jgi:hypothetical protein